MSPWDHDIVDEDGTQYDRRPDITCRHPSAFMQEQGSCIERPGSGRSSAPSFIENEVLELAEVRPIFTALAANCSETSSRSFRFHKRHKAVHLSFMRRKLYHGLGLTMDSLAEFASGALFGGALLGAGVYEPSIIKAQMDFSNNTMLTVFLGASATSA